MYLCITSLTGKRFFATYIFTEEHENRISMKILMINNNQRDVLEEFIYTNSVTRRFHIFEEKIIIVLALRTYIDVAKFTSHEILLVIFLQL